MNLRHPLLAADPLCLCAHPASAHRRFDRKACGMCGPYGCGGFRRAEPKTESVTPAVFAAAGGVTAALTVAKLAGAGLTWRRVTAPLWIVGVAYVALAGAVVGVSAVKR